MPSCDARTRTGPALTQCLFTSSTAVLRPPVLARYIKRRISDEPQTHTRVCTSSLDSSQHLCIMLSLLKLALVLPAFQAGMQALASPLATLAPTPASIAAPSAETIPLAQCLASVQCCQSTVSLPTVPVDSLTSVLPLPSGLPIPTLGPMAGFECSSATDLDILGNQWYALRIGSRKRTLSLTYVLTAWPAALRSAANSCYLVSAPPCHSNSNAVIC